MALRIAAAGLPIETTSPKCGTIGTNKGSAQAAGTRRKSACAGVRDHARREETHDKVKLVIFGATGGTGRQLVAQALEAGHSVTALVRVPARLNMQHPDLTVVQGNVLNAPTVLAAVFGKDAVISALGSRARGLPDLIQGTRNILTAMHDGEVRRSLWVSSFGVGKSLNQMGWLAQYVIVKGLLWAAIAEKEIQEQLIRASEGEWTIVRPGGLTDGPRTGVYRVIPEDATEKVGQPRIARADVADFILRALAEGTYIRQSVGLSY